MNAQRVGLSALRRAAVKQPGSFFAQNVARATLASNMSAMQSRAVATQKTSLADGNEILASQRLRRPVSPHLEIYDFQQTYLTGSIWQRFTGGALSGALYVYATAYLAAPLLGWHLESASIAAAFAELPAVVKGGVKFAMAWPLVYHSLNGVRHLLYDWTIGFNRKHVLKKGWEWGIASVLTTLAIFFI